MNYLKKYLLNKLMSELTVKFGWYSDITGQIFRRQYSLTESLYIPSTDNFDTTYNHTQSFVFFLFLSTVQPPNSHFTNII